MRKPKSRPVVALLVETSNAFSRELLQGFRDWMRAHGSSFRRSTPAGFNSSSHDAGSSCPSVPTDFGTL
jgi:hypothetical protein